MINRRSILGGLLAAIAAPHIPKSMAAPVASLKIAGDILLSAGDEFTIAGITDSRGRPMMFRVIESDGFGVTLSPSDGK